VKSGEEWPSEKWNFQDKYALKNIKKMKVKNNKVLKDSDESALNANDVTDEEMVEFLSSSAKSFGKKKAKKALEAHGKEEIMNMLENEPKNLLDIKGIKEKTIKKLVDAWSTFKQVMKGLPPSD